MYSLKVACLLFKMMLKLKCEWKCLLKNEGIRACLPKVVDEKGSDAQEGSSHVVPEINYFFLFVGFLHFFHFFDERRVIDFLNCFFIIEVLPLLNIHHFFDWVPVILLNCFHFSLVLTRPTLAFLVICRHPESGRGVKRGLEWDMDVPRCPAQKKVILIFEKGGKPE